MRPTVSIKSARAASASLRFLESSAVGAQTMCYIFKMGEQNHVLIKGGLLHNNFVRSESAATVNALKS